MPVAYYIQRCKWRAGASRGRVISERMQAVASTFAASGAPPDRLDRCRRTEASTTPTQGDVSTWIEFIRSVPRRYLHCRFCGVACPARLGRSTNARTLQAFRLYRSGMSRRPEQRINAYCGQRPIRNSFFEIRVLSASISATLPSGRRRKRATAPRQQQAISRRATRQQSTRFRGGRLNSGVGGLANRESEYSSRSPDHRGRRSSRQDWGPACRSVRRVLAGTPERTNYERDCRGSIRERCVGEVTFCRSSDGAPPEPQLRRPAMDRNRSGNRFNRTPAPAPHGNRRSCI